MLAIAVNQRVVSSYRIDAIVVAKQARAVYSTRLYRGTAWVATFSNEHGIQALKTHVTYVATGATFVL